MELLLGASIIATFIAGVPGNR